MAADSRIAAAAYLDNMMVGKTIQVCVQKTRALGWIDSNCNAAILYTFTHEACKHRNSHVSFSHLTTFSRTSGPVHDRRLVCLQE